MHRLHEFFLLGHDLGAELVALLTILGIVFLEFGPYGLG
jgi:hypothetical protein